MGTLGDNSGNIRSAAMHEEVLFVGGSHDGRRIDVGDAVMRRGRIELPARRSAPLAKPGVCEESPTFDIETYFLHAVRSGSHVRHVLFVHRDVVDVMGALVQGYREAKGVGGG